MRSGLMKGRVSSAAAAGAAACAGSWGIQQAGPLRRRRARPLVEDQTPVTPLPCVYVVGGSDQSSKKSMETGWDRVGIQGTTAIDTTCKTRGRRRSSTT